MSKVNETTGTTKVFKNPDCVRCELGIDVEEESFHCYNPFLRRKSEGITSGRGNKLVSGTEKSSIIFRDFRQCDTRWFSRQKTYWGRHQRKYGCHLWMHPFKKTLIHNISGLLKSFQKSNLPSSISIMLNFGTDDTHILYDASNNQHNCQVNTFCLKSAILKSYNCLLLV